MTKQLLSILNTKQVENLLSLSQDGENGSSLAIQQQKTITARTRQQKTATSQKSAASKDRGKRKRDSNAKEEMHQPKCKKSKCCENQSHDAKSSSVLSQTRVKLFPLPQPVKVTLCQVHHSKHVPQQLMVHQQVQKSLKVPQPLIVNPSHHQNQNLLIPPGIKTISLSDVVQQTYILRNENAELQARLALFKQLFMNKQKLISVVRTLGLTVI